MKTLGVLWLTLVMLVIFDGAIRKWVAPDYSNVLFIVKDIALVLFVLVAVNSHVHASRLLFRGWRRSAVSVALAAYIAICLLETFNPNLPSAALGFWGLKAHCLYATLALAVPLLYQGNEKLIWRDSALLLWCAIAVAGLGMVQFWLPQAHVLNRYAQGGVEEVATFGLLGHVRVTGTFSYISGMTTFMFASGVMAAVLVVGRDSRRFQNWVAIVAFATTMAAAAMTGSRWGIYIWGIVLSLILALCWRRLTWMDAARVAVLALVVTFAAIQYFGEAASAFRERAQTAGDDEARIETTLIGYSRFMDLAGPTGYGIGSTHQVAAALVPNGGSYHWLHPIDMNSFEDEPSRVMVELGWLGFIAWLGVRLLIVAYAWRVAVRAQPYPEFPLALWALCLVVAHLTTSVVFNVVASFFYWYAVGVLIYIDYVTGTRQAGSSARMPRSASR